MNTPLAKGIVTLLCGSALLLPLTTHGMNWNDYDESPHYAPTAMHPIITSMPSTQFPLTNMRLPCMYCQSSLSPFLQTVRSPAQAEQRINSITKPKKPGCSPCKNQNGSPSLQIRLLLGHYSINYS